MITLTLIQKIAVWALPVLFAITLHEAAHAWMAHRLGDSTAKMLGRLSINPLRHIDLIGTIFVPIFIAIITRFNFIFGWAKPVPINWQQLRNPRRDMAFVGAAGPVANFIMALFWASMLKIAYIIGPQESNTALFMALTGQAGILVNLILALLNLLPVPPLDGSRIVASLLPPRESYKYLKIEPWGLFILLGLLFSGFLGWLIGPLLSQAYNFILFLFKL